MNNELLTGVVKLISIDQIDILNPRERNGKAFAEIVENIRLIGLKKPITVTSYQHTSGQQRYHLICGEGRLKAFQILEQTTIPARIIEANNEEALIMSLAENIARRQYRSLELLTTIERLSDLGYDKNVIAKKIGLAPEYIQGIVRLLKNGEERLLAAVEQGRMSLSIALRIGQSGNNNQEIQDALQDAFESGTLKASELARARKIIQHRQVSGKSLNHPAKSNCPKVTATNLVRTYQKEMERQKLAVKKADMNQQKLAFIVGALRELHQDENFLTLLRAESLDSMPKYLHDRVWAS